jgi:transaldolase
MLDLSHRCSSVGTRVPHRPISLNVAGSFTVNTMPDETLHALTGHPSLRPPLPEDGLDLEGWAAVLRGDGALSFVESWNDLMAVIASKCAVLGGPALKVGRWARSGRVS